MFDKKTLGLCVLIKKTLKCCFFTKILRFLAQPNIYKYIYVNIYWVVLKNLKILNNNKKDLLFGKKW